MIPSVDNFTVGIVTALAKELTAIRAALDEEYGINQNQDDHDHNNYVLGRIHRHNVVVICLPAGVDGTNAAANAVTNMTRSFKSIKFALMVGIGGGIPYLEKDGVLHDLDVHLGDVVVSQPTGTNGGVVQYDKGKSLQQGGFILKGHLNQPPGFLLTALNTLQSSGPLISARLVLNLAEMNQRNPHLERMGFKHPGTELDLLYCSKCPELISDDPNPECSKQHASRQSRPDTQPKVHYGIIASGNKVVKDAEERDRLGQELGALCVEMEAAGLMNILPTLVVRGICDYADSHKSDTWHEYAAATAAAMLREILSVVPSQPLMIEEKPNIQKYHFGLNLSDAPDLPTNLFVGRDAELEDMETILTPGSIPSTRKTLVLGGMGGIGKTQLSITYAKKHSTSYSSIFWLNATSESSLLASMRRIASRILTPERFQQLDTDQSEKEVLNWLSEQDNSRWLLIYDNYDEPEHYSINKHYPPMTHGSIIITTRVPNRVNGQKVRVRSLPEEADSIRILATRSERPNIETDPGAIQLVQRLNGHPLALSTAGAFLNQSSVSFSRYLEQYETKWDTLPDSMDELPDYPARTLYSTWDISLSQIRQQNQHAAMLLQFFAYLDHQDIWFDFFRYVDPKIAPAWFREVMQDEFIFEKAMRVLTNFCLVEPQYDTGSYSLHVCVHQWTLNNLNRVIDPALYWLAFECVYSNVAESSSHSSRNLSLVKYRRVVPHVTRLVIGRFQSTAEDLVWLEKSFKSSGLVAELCRQQDEYKAAEQISRNCLHFCETKFGQHDIRTLVALSDLAYTYLHLEKLDQAQELLERSLAGHETTNFKYSKIYFRAVYNLARLYFRRNDTQKAKEMFQKALEGFEKTDGPDSIDCLDIMTYLGSIHRTQKDMQAAERLYNQALQGYEKRLGSEHVATLVCLNSIGNLYHTQRKYDEEFVIREQVYTGFSKALGDHTFTHRAAENIGALYYRQGQLDQAQPLLEKALNAFEKHFGPSSPDACRVAARLGRLYQKQGKLQQAQQMLERGEQGYHWYGRAMT